MKACHQLFLLSILHIAGCSDYDTQSEHDATSSVVTTTASSAPTNDNQAIHLANQTAEADQAVTAAVNATLAADALTNSNANKIDTYSEALGEKNLARQPIPAGGININPRINEGILPYIAASSADTTNGGLAQLLKAHRKSCATNDPDAFYELFNQQTKYLYTHLSQQALLDNFLLSCSKDFLGQLEIEFSAGNLIISEDGKTEAGGIRRKSLCNKVDYSNGVCKNEIELSVENGSLRWGWH